VAKLHNFPAFEAKQGMTAIRQSALVSVEEDSKMEALDNTAIVGQQVRRIR
jgi:hypothetical protein